MEHIQEYLPEYISSNSIAVVVLLLAWKKPHAARVGFGIVFLSASIANACYALTTPEVYLEYEQFAVLPVYRKFILGWFATHVQPMVLSIAAGQLIIAIGMFFGRSFTRVAIIGTVVFSLAIAPLGIGSGFPCTVLLAVGAMVLGKQLATTRTAERTQ